MHYIVAQGIILQHLSPVFYIQGTKALQDAGLSYKDIEQAVVGYCFGDSTSGQTALYELGMTGIPIYNVSVISVIEIKL
jgi:hypothetical protein